MEAPLYNLAQIIGHAAKKYPHKTAFKCWEATVTFSELEEKTNQLATCLIGQGVRKGDRVGILMHRCLDTAIAIYGILKAGAVYVPIDPFLPNARMAFVVKDCGIKHVVTTEQHTKKIKTLVTQHLDLETVIGSGAVEGLKTLTWDAVFSTTPYVATPVAIVADDLAYILYTSGSTGTPKGIMHTHASGLAFAALVAKGYQLQPEDIIANSAPIHFDVSLLGYCAAPLAAATTIIIPDAHLKFPLSLSELVAKEQVSIWYSVPLLLIELLHKGGIQYKDFSSLRWVLFAGEVFATKQLRALMQVWPQAVFSNIYGPTELNQCTYYNLTTPPETDAPIPIGTTWGNTEFKILDANDKAVAKGEEGLLVVRSATLMKGYWNNKALTEAALYKETIVPGYEQVYYRTGDVVRLNAANELLFLGRQDRQIKLRGFRIEIDAIETVLLAHDAVLEAAVVLIETDTDVSRLEAAVILDTDCNVKVLDAHCRAHLPSYAVPNSITIQSSFPRTSSGKIDRKQIETLL